MPPSSPSGHGSIRAPHPLALALIEHLKPGARVLEIGTGGRRNVDALEAAGFSVTRIDPRDLMLANGAFDAALSTHGLLHGRPEQIAKMLSRIAELLATRGALYATFGSSADRRFGRGDRIDDFTYAEPSGDERGVAHAFFDAQRLRELLTPHFDPELIEEHNVDDIAGMWAHPSTPLRGAVHWFVIARRLSTPP